MIFTYRGDTVTWYVDGTEYECRWQNGRRVGKWFRKQGEKNLDGQFLDRQTKKVLEGWEDT